VVYVDESGVDNTLDYPYGWCHQSQRFEADKLGHRTCRISMIAAWCNGHLLAPMTFKGYCDPALVETWVEQLLVPKLQAGQVVIMDNASFHKSTAIDEMIEAAGCKLLFLPPYSSDLQQFSVG